MEQFGAVLEARDPARGRFRAYRIEAGTDLFGGKRGRNTDGSRRMVLQNARRLKHSVPSVGTESRRHRPQLTVACAGLRMSFTEDSDRLAAPLAIAETTESKGLAAAWSDGTALGHTQG